MIWGIFAVLTLVAVGAVLLPLIRGARADDAVAAGLNVLKDQLAEVERDLARGTLSPTEAESARTEIQRRMLATSRRSVSTPAGESAGLRAGVTAALAVLLPFAALGIYLGLGSPNLKSTPMADAGGHGDADFAGMVEQLAARVQADPDNPEGWGLLARSYRQLERYADARDAYRRLLALTPDNAQTYSDYGEMITAAAGGDVTDEALEAFLGAVNRERSDPRARFYIGMYYAQRNDPRTAIAIWRDLTAGAPDDAPWVQTVRQQMMEVAQATQTMPMNVEPRHPLDIVAAPGVASAEAPGLSPGLAPGSNAQPPQVAPGQRTVEQAAMEQAKAEAPVVPPSDPNDITSPDVSALKGKFSGENLAGIQAMVGSLAGRLENTPEDYNGWMMLARSYTVLQNIEGAKGAYERAMALKPDDLDPKRQYIALAWTGTDVEGAAPVPEKLATVARDTLKIDPRVPEALLVDGLIDAKKGDKDAARSKWQMAAAAAPAGSPLAAQIDRRLKSLP